MPHGPVAPGAPNPRLVHLDMVALAAWVLDPGRERVSGGGGPAVRARVVLPC